LQKILSLVTISIDNLLTSRLFNWENKVANAKKKKAAKVTTRVVESGDTVVPKKQKTDKKSVKVAPKEQRYGKVRRENGILEVINRAIRWRNYENYSCVLMFNCQ